MASVTLDDLWLHDAANLSSSIAGALTGEDESTSKPGEVRRYANGRLRSITGAGSSVELRLQMDLADRADVDVLRGWVKTGTKLLLREPKGRLLWGVVFALDVTEVAGASDDFADASFTFRQVTVDEAV